VRTVGSVIGICRENFEKLYYVIAPPPKNVRAMIISKRSG